MTHPLTDTVLDRCDPCPSRVGVASAVCERLVYHRNQPPRIVPLHSAGKLVRSQVPPLPGCSGTQGHFAGGFKGTDRGVYRQLYSPASWTRILTRHGFTATRAGIIHAPHPGDVGTVLVETHIPGTPA